MCLWFVYWAINMVYGAFYLLYGAFGWLKILKLTQVDKVKLFLCDL